MTETINTISENERQGVIRMNWPLTIVAVLISALAGWTVSLIPGIEDMQLTAGIAAGVSCAIYLFLLFNTGGSRSATVIRFTSSFTLILTGIILCAMAVWCETPSYMIITVSFIMLIFIATVLAVAKSGQ